MIGIRSVKHFALAGITSAVLATGLAACSSSSTPKTTPTTTTSTPTRTPVQSPAAKALAAAAQKTSAAPSADLSLNFNIVQPSGSASSGSAGGASGSGSPVVIAGALEGPYDITATKGNFAIRVTSGSAASLACQLLFGGSSTTCALTPVYLVDGIAYIHVPSTGVLSTEANGKPYLKVSLSALLGLFASGLSSTFSNPAVLFDLLETPALHATEIGPSTIGTTPTTEYKATVNIADAVSAGGPAASLYKGIESAAAGTKTETTTVFVGSDGNLARLSLAIHDLPAGPAGLWPQGSTLNLSLTLTNFGAPVVVTPPPASEYYYLSHVPNL